MPAVVGLTLIIPDKPDVERDAVAAAWQEAGGAVLRLGRFWDPPALDPRSVRVYGWDIFCQVVAQKLGLRLLGAPDDALGDIERWWLHRHVEVVALPELANRAFPLFVKSVVPKQMPSRVYVAFDDVLGAIASPEAGERFVLSEPVAFRAEVRAFVHEGRVVTAAAYEGSVPDLWSAAAFVEAFAAAHTYARTFVVDAGLLSDGRWAVVELNATWGAGLNGCDARAVAGCLADAVEAG